MTTDMMKPPFFFFNDTATTEIYTLSLHDALPIFHGRRDRRCRARLPPPRPNARSASDGRSEEHTSELQSQSNLVCRLLLEKKKISSPRSAVMRTPAPRDWPLIRSTVMVYLRHVNA